MALFTKKALPQFPVKQELDSPQVAKWFGLVEETVPVIRTFTVTVDAPSVAANTTGIKSVTVAGLDVNDIVYVNKPSHEAGLGIVNCRVSAASTMEITYMNTTGSAINEASESYKGFAIRL